MLWTVRPCSTMAEILGLSSSQARSRSSSIPLPTRHFFAYHDVRKRATLPSLFLCRRCGSRPKEDTPLVEAQEGELDSVGGSSSSSKVCWRRWAGGRGNQSQTGKQQRGEMHQRSSRMYRARPLTYNSSRSDDPPPAPHALPHIRGVWLPVFPVSARACLPCSVCWHMSGGCCDLQK